MLEITTKLKTIGPEYKNVEYIKFDQESWEKFLIKYEFAIIKEYEFKNLEADYEKLIRE